MPISHHRSSRRRPAALLAATCAVAGLATLAAPGAALAGKKAVCPASGDTIAANASVRVYTKPNADEIDPLYACEKKAGKPFKLDANKGRECQNSRRADEVLVAGTRIAIRMTECELETSFDYLSVWDAKTRKRTARADGGVVPERQPTPTVDGFTNIDSMVLRSTGAVAWVGRGGYTDNSQPNIEVRRLTAAGKNERLDSGPGIAGPSLALSPGGTVYWTNAGVLKSAGL